MKQKLTVLTYLVTVNIRDVFKITKTPSILWFQQYSNHSLPLVNLCQSATTEFSMRPRSSLEGGAPSPQTLYKFTGEAQSLSSDVFVIPAQILSRFFEVSSSHGLRKI